MTEKLFKRLRPRTGAAGALRLVPTEEGANLYGPRTHKVRLFYGQRLLRMTSV